MAYLLIFLYLNTHVNTIHYRHAYICNYQIRIKLLTFFKTFLSVSSSNDFKIGRKILGNHISHLVIILYNQ